MCGPQWVSRGHRPGICYRIRERRTLTEYLILLWKFYYYSFSCDNGIEGFLFKESSFIDSYKNNLGWGGYEMGGNR